MMLTHPQPLLFELESLISCTFVLFDLIPSLAQRLCPRALPAASLPVASMQCGHVLQVVRANADPDVVPDYVEHGTFWWLPGHGIGADDFKSASPSSLPVWGDEADNIRRDLDTSHSLNVLIQEHPVGHDTKPKAVDQTSTYGASDRLAVVPDLVRRVAHYRVLEAGGLSQSRVRSRRNVSR